MDDRQRTRLVGWVIAAMVLAVAWDLVGKLRHPAAPVSVPPPVAADLPASPPPRRSEAGTEMPSADTTGPGYLDLVARAEMRRRIRASYPLTYLRDVVAESSDSMLHRWDDRVARPVRVYLGSDTIPNFRPSFLDAVRTAFVRWGETGVPVRFDLNVDSTDAEVRFVWRTKFDIDRTGETDLEWDRDGHLRTALVTISTFDPRGRPLGPDDVRVVALHEIGHLIGLDHSPDSTDVMFAKAVVRDLSPRDIATAELLYQLAPGSLR